MVWIVMLWQQRNIIDCLVENLVANHGSYSWMNANILTTWDLFSSAMFSFKTLEYVANVKIVSGGVSLLFLSLFCGSQWFYSHSLLFSTLISSSFSSSSSSTRTTISSALELLSSLSVLLISPWFPKKFPTHQQELIG